MRVEKHTFGDDALPFIAIECVAYNGTVSPGEVDPQLVGSSRFRRSVYQGEVADFAAAVDGTTV
jgi:hypothetical protein